MIGGAALRRIGTVIGIGLVVGGGFGLRSADPARADPPLAAARGQALASAAGAADAALARLAAILADAIDHARKGSAQTVAGDRAPSSELEAAADVVAQGAGTAEAAVRAMASLSGMAAALAPGVRLPPLSFGSSDLLLMAVGLRSSAEAATLFVERRHATVAVVDALRDGVSALDQDRPEAALASLDEATAPLALLDQWTKRPPLLDYWMKVTRQLLDAARGVATATIARDPAAQAAAAERYRAAGDLARGADNALAVSLSEEGGAVSAAQLQRLAAAAKGVEDGRAAVQLLANSTP